MSAPRLWIVAGPNGAGKTTLVQSEMFRALLPRTRALNPDDRTLEVLRLKGYPHFAGVPADTLKQAFVEAADAVFGEVEELLRRGKDVCVETVLSTDKYFSVVDNLLKHGGELALIYVALRSPELACDRVAHRVKLGGHDVPPNRIASRWIKSLANLPWFARRATAFWIFDNSDSNPITPPLLIAEGGAGRVVVHHPQAIPEITRVLETLN